MSAGKVEPDPQRPGFHRFRWDAPSVNGQRRQVVRRGFASKREAQQALDDFKRSVHAARGVIPSRATFAALLERWLPVMNADPRLKPTTKASYRGAAKHLVRHCGEVRLDQLTGEHLDALYASLRAEGRSESLIHAIHVTAHKSLKAGMKWRLVTSNAAEDCESPAHPRANPVAWTPVQVAVFLEHGERDRWWPLWLLLASTACRRGEACGLRWSDLDLERRTWTVANNTVVAEGVLYEGSPKGNRARSIRLDAATLGALRAWKATQNSERLLIGDYWPGGDYVFTWGDGRVLHPNVVSRTFSRIVKRAGLPPYRLHGLRHAWATAALDAGVEVKDIASRLGHSSTRITNDIYVAPSTDRDARAAEVVADLYRRAR